MKEVYFRGTPRNTYTKCLYLTLKKRGLCPYVRAENDDPSNVDEGFEEMRMQSS